MYAKNYTPLYKFVFSYKKWLFEENDPEFDKLVPSWTILEHSILIVYVSRKPTLGGGGRRVESL